MNNNLGYSSLWNGFEKVLCLTLEGEIERQISATKELCDIGLDKFQFFQGVKNNDQRIVKIYEQNNVFSFPPCFRCGEQKCNCDNNLLIPSQVACFLSFLDIFEFAINSPFNTFLVAEDDIQVKHFNEKVLREVLNIEVLRELSFFNSKIPCLLSMGRPQPVKVYRKLYWEKNKQKPSNYLFGFNKSFAKLAKNEFEKFNTTSDLFIHQVLASKANSYSLSSHIATDYSWCSQTIRSSIHPKRGYVTQLKDSNKKLIELKKYEEHIKKAIYVPYWISGIPRGGTKWASVVAHTFGIDIGHEELKSHGISSWMYIDNPFTKAPFCKDKYSENPFYIYSQKKILIVRPLLKGLGSQIIENEKNIQSYSFRKKIIQKNLNFDLDKIYCPLGKAIFSIICSLFIFDNCLPFR